MCNQTRGIEGCVVSNESIGLVAVSLWEAAFELALERSRLWAWHVAVSSQLSSDPVPNRSSACNFLIFCD